jgi:hypothetical protein
MNERIHRYLDGELRWEDLTPEERLKIATHEAVIWVMEDSYGSVEVPDLTARVMSRLPANAGARDMIAPRSSAGIFRKRGQRTLSWLWQPHRVNMRPAYGILAAAALFILVVLPNSRVFAPEHLIDSGTASVAAKVFIQFRLDAPQASKVRLAGSFTGWQPIYTLEEITPGIWSILIPLDPGVHNYAFVVNGGEWIADPAAPAVDDGFGGVNSRLSVLLPNGFSRL